MTEKQQKRFYFPNWATCVAANGWKQVKGRLELDEAKLNDHGRKVLAAAQAIATGQHRAPVLDDLRHGVHVVALGRDKSSTKLNNRELDQVVALMKLMVNETDIAADQTLSNPALGERERLLIRIHRLKVPDAMIHQICLKSFAPVYNGTHYEDLPLVNLRALAGILTEIRDRKKTTPHPGPLPIPQKPECGEGELIPAAVADDAGEVKLKEILEQTLAIPAWEKITFTIKS